MGMVHGLDDLLCGYAMPMLKLGEQLLDGFKSQVNNLAGRRAGHRLHE